MLCTSLSSGGWVQSVTRTSLQCMLTMQLTWGPLGRLKVRLITPRSWINCPPEVFHLCGTENIRLPAWPWGKLFSGPLDVTTSFQICGQWLRVQGDRSGNDLVKEEKFPNLSLHLKHLESSSLETVQSSHNWTPYTHSHALLWKYAQGIVVPCSLFWARESDIMKANSMTRLTFCCGSIVLKTLNACQTWYSLRTSFHKDTSLLSFPFPLLVFVYFE